MSECGFNLWTDIIIPIIISPLLLVLKLVYDRWNNKKAQSLLLKNKLKLDKTRDQLKNFYWPLYIRLLKDFDIWSRFTIYDKDFYEFVESDTDSDIEEFDDIKRCSFNNCNIPVHYNSNMKGQLYCLRHYKFKTIQNIQITNHTENINIDIPINYSPSNKINDSIITNNSVPGNLSGNNVGEISELEHFSKQNQIDIDKDIYKTLIEILLKNYNEINKLLIDNISIAEPNTQIGKQLIRFMKFSLIISALIKSEKSIDPTKYDSPYPKKLLPLVEKKVFILQKKYNNLIKDFYYK